MEPAHNPLQISPETSDWLAFFRRRIISVLLGSTSVVATVGILYILRPYIQNGNMPSWNVWIYLAAYLGLLAITLLPQIPVGVRSFAFLFLLYAFAVFSFYSGWLASSGRGYLLALIVLSTILGGVRPGLIAALLSLLTYLAFAFTYHEGWLPLPKLPPPSEAVPITIEGFGFLMTVGMIGIAMWFFREGMAAVSRVATASQQAQLELDQRARDLNLANQLLAERTRHLEMTNQALELQMWQETGNTQLNEILYQEHDLSTLANRLAGFLAHYVSAEIVGIYLHQDDRRFHRVGAYAMPADSVEQAFAPGEGLVGQVALGKRTILLSEILPGHLVVRSGLGETRPSAALFVPLIINDQVNGVIELGFLQTPAERQVRFMEKVSETIAAAFNTALTRRRVESLLRETTHQAEILRVQEEELRQANTELEARTRRTPDPKD